MGQTITRRTVTMSEHGSAKANVAGGGPIDAIRRILPQSYLLLVLW